MRVEDLVVEVRDADLNRVGQIIDDNLVNALFIKRFNAVGTWSVRLPYGDPLADYLRQPGYGLLVSYPGGTLISGPTLSAKLVQSQTDVLGQWLIEGADDLVLLSEHLAYPQPSNDDVGTQNVSHDRRSGVAESVIKGYIEDNMGPSAPLSRRVPNLTVEADAERGADVSVMARFDNLQEFVYGISQTSNLGFEVNQIGDGLVFGVYEPTDKRSTIRMDLQNKQLTSTEYVYQAPKLTNVIVGGAGADEGRTFIERVSEQSVEAANLWQRRIEMFIDARGGEATDELAQAGDEKLAEEGFTLVSMSVTPSDDQTMRYGFDWGLGDVVTVVAGLIEASAVVTEVGVSVGFDGVRIAASIGSLKATNFESRVIDKTNDHEQRISNIERNDGGGGGGGAGTSFYGQCSRQTDGNIVITTAGQFVPTGLSATFDSANSAGTSLGTSDLFGIKNTTGFTILARVFASADVVGGNNEMLGIKIALNGVAIDETQCNAFTGGNAQEAKLVSQWMIELAPNDEVSLMVANMDTTVDLVLKRGRVVVSGVVGPGPQGATGNTGATGAPGATGPAGPPGPLGSAGTVEIGVLTIINPDQPPYIVNVGTDQEAVLDISLPRAPEFEVGTVTTGAAGSSAVVTDVGTNGDVVLDFQIPQGQPGSLSNLTVIDPLVYDEGTSTLYIDRPVGDVTSLASRTSLQAWGLVIDNQRVYSRGDSAVQSGTGTSTTDNPARVVFPRQTGNLVDTEVSSSSYALFETSSGNGNFWVWGENNTGQLGLGTTTDQPIPVQPSPNNTVREVYAPKNRASYAHDTSRTIVKRNNGTWWGTGNNSNGVLGFGNTTNLTSFTSMPHLNTLDDTRGIADLQLWGNTYPVMWVFCDDGTIWAAGHNASGQLGTGNTTQQTTLVDVTAAWGGTGMTTVQLIVGTGYFDSAANASGNTMMLREDNTTGERFIYVSGEGGWGTFGRGTTVDSTTPVVVPNGTIGTDIVKIAKIGGPISANYALLGNGDLYAWGYNGYGQLGIGNTTQQNSPVLSATGVADLPMVFSDAHTYPYRIPMFYKGTDGFIYGAGRNNVGQLGDGTVVQRNSWVPVYLPSEADIVDIETLGYADQGFTVFLTSRGRLYGTGYNGRKDLYDWTTTNVLVPFLLSMPPV